MSWLVQGKRHVWGLVNHPCIVEKYRLTTSWKKEQVFLEIKQVLLLSFVAPFSFMLGELSVEQFFNKMLCYSELASVF